MKAIIATKYGSPDVLELKEVDKPVPADNEVLVKIHATTVNRTDNATLKAIPFFARFMTGLLKPKNPILGTEFAGEIQEIGKDVSYFRVGDRVFGFSDKDFGTHAEYLAIGEDMGLATIPNTILYDEAAASTEGVFYGLNFINKVDLQSGERVFVNGATGTIGSATVQLLVYYGARVTATCRTKDIDLVRSLGAEKVIDYEREDLTKDSDKYNYFFDTVGKSSFFKIKKLLLPNGVYISSDLGFMWQNIPLPLITPLFGGKKTIFPIPTDLKGCIKLTKKLMGEGKFKPVIDRKYTLEQISEAYRYVEKGQKTENVVITVRH